MQQKLRFEVFKKNSFTCHYCGNKPPRVILEVDHIIPRIEGGLDEIENLVTACFKCNRGKGKRMLTELSPELQKNADLLKEKKEQLEAFYKYQQEIDSLSKEAVEIVDSYWLEVSDGKYHLRGPERSTIKRFLRSFSIEEIKEAIDLSTRIRGSEARFRYLCGILHNKRLQNEDPEVYELIKYWKSKGGNFYRKEGLETLLKGDGERGWHTPIKLEKAKEIIDVLFSKRRNSYYATLVEYLDWEGDLVDDIVDYHDQEERRREVAWWIENKEKISNKEPLLYKALVYYITLTGLHDIESDHTLNIFRNLLKNYDLDEVCRIIEFATYRDLYSTHPYPMYDLININSLLTGESDQDSVKVKKKYDEWLDKEYKVYKALCREAIAIKESDQIDDIKKYLLIIASKYNVDDGEHILLHLAATEGELSPEKLATPESIYDDYLREAKDVEEFMKKRRVARS